jgi:hypothetical protein
MMVPSSLPFQMFERYLHLAHFCTLRTALDLVTEQQEEQQQKMAAGGLLAELNALRLRLSVAMLRLAIFQSNPTTKMASSSSGSPKSFSPTLWTKNGRLMSELGSCEENSNELL